MSFNLNLSSSESSEEDEDEEEEEEEEDLVPTIDNHHKTNIVPTVSNSNPQTNDDDDDDDEIDWEDGESYNIPEQQQQTTITTPLQRIQLPNKEITIDFTPRSHKSNTKQHKQTPNRKLNKIKLIDLPSDISSLVLSIHRSHLLSLVCRSVFLSNLCRCYDDDDLLSHVALSSVPTEFLELQNRIPTERELRRFATWFFEFVNRVGERRRRRMEENAAAGAPVANGRRVGRRRGVTRTAVRNGFNKRKRSQSGEERVDTKQEGQGASSPSRLIDLFSALSPSNDDIPQSQSDLILNDLTPHEKTQLFIVMTRSLQWRVRYVTNLQPIERDLTVHHPLFQTKTDLFQSTTTQQPSLPLQSITNSNTHQQNTLAWAEVLCQPQTQNQKQQWIHIDIDRELLNQPSQMEQLTSSNGTKRQRRRGSILQPVSYVLAVEHSSTNNETTTSPRLTDVTPRYANSWYRTVLKRGATKRDIATNGEGDDASWWKDTLKRMNRRRTKERRRYDRLEKTTIPVAKKRNGVASLQHQKTQMDKNEMVCSSKTSEKDVIVINDDDDSDDEDEHETKELLALAKQEPIPTRKTAFKNHPVYALSSLLNQTQVLSPDASRRICGMFKGELIYRRTDVTIAKTRHQWRYAMRKVKRSEWDRPAKTLEIKRKPVSHAFKPLKTYGINDNINASKPSTHLDNDLDEEDDMQQRRLYGHWQTEPYKLPYIHPEDDIPQNEHGNIEKALLNPGLVHLETPGMSKVAKRLNIPYVPCLIGFEGHYGNRTPTIRGIAVHEPNAELLKEAFAEWESRMVEMDVEKRQKEIYLRWKRVIRGILVKERLEREYGDDE